MIRPPQSHDGPRGRSARALWIACATAATVIVLLAAGEASGWPFLRGPLERNLQRLAGFHLVARRGYRLALDSDGALRNKGLKPRPAHIGKGANEGEVKTARLRGDRFKNSGRL